MNNIDIFFALIKNEITGAALNIPSDVEVNAIAVLRIAKKQDLAHLVADALIRNGIVTYRDKIYKSVLREKLIAYYRDIHRTFFYKTVAQTLTENGIRYVPMKGILLCKLYAEPWMRNSCDLDILIEENDVEKATAALIQSGLTTDEKMGYHHMSFFQEKNHLELHFNICEDNEQVDRLLKNVWDNVYLKDGYEYRESSEFFVFHHIAHMVYHFLSGGCGIRTLIDLWIMKRKEFYSEEKVLPLLEQCDLVKFYRSVCKLAEVWLGDEKHDDLTIQLEKYIISGGVYGSEDNANAVGAVKYGGKIKYLLRLAFLPYKSMCIIYPSLKKFKVLLPFYYIHRIFYKLFGRDRKQAKERINSTMSQSKENILSLNTLLDELNLK